MDNQEKLFAAAMETHNSFSIPLETDIPNFITYPETEGHSFDRLLNHIAKTMEGDINIKFNSENLFNFHSRKKKSSEMGIKAGHTSNIIGELKVDNFPPYGFSMNFNLLSEGKEFSRTVYSNSIDFELEASISPKVFSLKKNIESLMSEAKKDFGKIKIKLTKKDLTSKQKSFFEKVEYAVQDFYHPID